MATFSTDVGSPLSLTHRLGDTSGAFLLLWSEPKSWATDIMQHRTDGTDAFDTLYIGCETVCANEGRAELVPAMPSAAKLGALVHKFPYHDSFSLSVSGVS